MDVALMNEKVTFLKNAVVTDEVGNHTNVWEKYYSFFATVGGEGLASSKEEDAAMTVTVRYCRKTAELLEKEVERALK